jgi:protein-S-isoprenylcysteine O-methyltransferase Ste14
MAKEKTMETNSNQATAPADTAHHPAGATSRAALLRRLGMQQAMAGAIAFVIGLVITVVTFQHPVGGIFFVPTGVMVVGAIYVVRGLVTVAKSMKRG